MKDLKSIIAENIVTLRISRRMTQLELAERLNYSDKAVSKWERGESLPDVTVLKEVADIFSVSLDYLVSVEHPAPEPAPSPIDLRQRARNRAFITGMCVLLGWLVATLAFVVTHIASAQGGDWLAFLYAVPVSIIIWLVFNSVWFDRRRNFLIVSLLVWSVLLSIYLSLLVFGGYNVWLIFALGIPGQIIIILWSRLKF